MAHVAELTVKRSRIALVFAFLTDKVEIGWRRKVQASRSIKPLGLNLPLSRSIRPGRENLEGGTGRIEPHASRHGPLVWQKEQVVKLNVFEKEGRFAKELAHRRGCHFQISGGGHYGRSGNTMVAQPRDQADVEIV